MDVHPELISTLRRTADAIFNKGGIIRKVENLGTRNLPYKMSAHGSVHKQGSYFVFQFICPPSSLHNLEEEYGRDVDIVRRRIFKMETPEEFECTLHEEIKPPAYRKDVQKMIEESKKIDKYKFKYNSGLDYCPFQK
ncbi:probable 28S ribosomal protein S6, mitochondrial isoform X2 [Zootermopsis nevadensis]|uniref:probable 28S ribosomal protein S6, mitochondrial isoform X2 n=1 Tax=Zootermopsis nevadensis TaxID=136037 RepID=UPI000B8EC030|nr:probable 28S ribosomal protein S6, mitochondrial isoform X2 [Zootermopsis nevadensis]